jgi:hypothetical protein
MPIEDRTQPILALMRRYGIEHFDYSDSAGTLSLSLTPYAKGVIKAPYAGVFTRRHPMATQETEMRTAWKKGEIIGYLAIQALLRPVLCPEDCHKGIIKIEDGTRVGYGAIIAEYD